MVTVALALGAGVFADSLVQGASLGEAFLAGISTAALSAAAAGTFPVDGGFGLNPATFRHVATVATVGGITSSLQGGRFGHGFLAAGLGSAAAGIPALGRSAAARLASRTVVSAVTAGTVSEITGGKFANGALSAAFVALASGAVRQANAGRPDYGAMSEQEFREFIEGAFGMSFEEIEHDYSALTSEGLTPAELKRAFADHSYVKSMGDKFDVQLRRIMNLNPPETLTEAFMRGYKKAGFFESLFHDPINNIKVIGPLGHKEAVYRRIGETLIPAGAAHAGTFNFFSPVNPMGHFSADVVPYLRRRQ